MSWQTHVITHGQDLLDLSGDLRRRTQPTHLCAGPPWRPGPYSSSTREPATQSNSPLTWEATGSGSCAPRPHRLPIPPPSRTPSLGSCCARR
jgi:hypothetical protein